MGHQLHPRGLTVAIAVAGVLITGCSGGSAAPPESTPPLSDPGTPNRAGREGRRRGERRRGAQGVDPPGAARRAGRHERRRSRAAPRRRAAPDPLPEDGHATRQLGAAQAQGLARERTDGGPAQRRARRPGEARDPPRRRAAHPATRYEVLGVPDPATAEKQGTCLNVYEGEVEWEAKGDVQSFTAGHGTFAANGNRAEPARCPSLCVARRVAAGHRARSGDEALGALDGYLTTVRARRRHDHDVVEHDHVGDVVSLDAEPSAAGHDRQEAATADDHRDDADRGEPATHDPRDHAADRAGHHSADRAGHHATDRAGHHATDPTRHIPTHRARHLGSAVAARRAPTVHTATARTSSGSPRPAGARATPPA